jgi:hypothetical protein
MGWMVDAPDGEPETGTRVAEPTRVRLLQGSEVLGLVSLTSLCCCLLDQLKEMLISMAITKAVAIVVARCVRQCVSSS